MKKIIILCLILLTTLTGCSNEKPVESEEPNLFEEISSEIISSVVEVGVDSLINSLESGATEDVSDGDPVSDIVNMLAGCKLESAKDLGITSISIVGDTVLLHASTAESDWSLYYHEGVAYLNSGDSTVHCTVVEIKDSICALNPLNTVQLSDLEVVDKTTIDGVATDVYTVPAGTYRYYQDGNNLVSLAKSESATLSDGTTVTYESLPEDVHTVYTTPMGDTILGLRLSDKGKLINYSCVQIDEITEPEFVANSKEVSESDFGTALFQNVKDLP